VDDQKFDALAKGLASGRVSRRTLVRALGGGMLGVLAAAAGRADPAAAQAACRGAGHPCEGTQACCAGLVCQASGPGGALRCTACRPGTKACGAACAACCSDSDCSGATCHTGTCQNGACTLTPVTDGTACDDGNKCTQTDTCQNGACVGGNPVVCTALDQCHDVGTCDPLTGTCSNPNKTDGTACNDGNKCTSGDTCQGGVCQGGAAAICPQSSNPCLTVVCDPAQGCVTKPQPAGTACSDNNACTVGDACDGNGTCVPGTAVTCGPCLTCDTSSGQCVADAAQNGNACPGAGNLCFAKFVCLQGSCTGADPVVCQASDQCHVAGTCDPTTGVCSNPDADDGTACNDGNQCTQKDVCVSGVCTGGDPVTCSAGGICTTIACDPTSGQCVATPETDGTQCTNAAGVSGTCSGGQCAVPSGACTRTIACAQSSNPCLQVTCVGNDCVLGNGNEGGTCQTSTGSSGTCQQGSCIASCTPATCASLAAVCGTPGDGCGGTLTCGNCPPGDTCTNGQCSGPTCTPLGEACSTGAECCQTAGDVLCSAPGGAASGTVCCLPPTSACTSDFDCCQVPCGPSSGTCGGS